MDENRSNTDPEETAARAADDAEKVDASEPSRPPESAPPREIGGRGGLDPVRYGDWEKDGRCIDF